MCPPASAKGWPPTSSSGGPRAGRKSASTNRPRLQALLTGSQERRPLDSHRRPSGERRSFSERRRPSSSRTPRAGCWSIICSGRPPRSSAKFRAYLAEIPVAAGAAKRIEYAEARLGSLEDARSRGQPPRPAVAAIGRGASADVVRRPLLQPSTGLSPMFFRISARCFS